MSCSEGLERSIERAGSVGLDTIVRLFIEDIEDIGASAALIDGTKERVGKGLSVDIVRGENEEIGGLAVDWLEIVVNFIVEHLCHCYGWG